jgi:hypothetical protein
MTPANHFSDMVVDSPRRPKTREILWSFWFFSAQSALPARYRFTLIVATPEALPKMVFASIFSLGFSSWRPPYPTTSYYLKLSDTKVVDDDGKEFIPHAAGLDR